jgi:hypothetical protein
MDEYFPTDVAGFASLSEISLNDTFGLETTYEAYPASTSSQDSLVWTEAPPPSGAGPQFVGGTIGSEERYGGMNQVRHLLSKHQRRRTEKP